jgi:hypothetical protein
MLDRRLSEINFEYESKRRSLRLGALRLELMPAGTWHEWGRRRFLQLGGAWEQYKHPCLINDLKFRDSVTVIEEVNPDLITAKVA